MSEWGGQGQDPDSPNSGSGSSSSSSSSFFGNLDQFLDRPPPSRQQAQSENPRYSGGKTPPANIEAERSVLGGILLRNENLDRAREIGLIASDFYRDTHQKIFSACEALNERREPIDLLSLKNTLEVRGHLAQVGGAAALAGVLDEAFNVGNFLHYAKIIRNKSILRKMIDACSTIIEDAYGGVEDTENFLDEAEQKVFSVADIQLESSVTPIKDILLANMSKIEELALRKSEVTGLATGFTKLDRITTGLHPGQVMILAARPGMGKTSWFISALQHASISQGAVTALFSLEMTKEELGFRFLSGLSRIDSRRLKTGRLSDRDWHSLAEAADQLSKARIFVDDSGAVTVMDIRARCRRLLSSQKRLDLIVVDYLQLMKGPKGGKEFSREREISEISRGLKELAKELSVPIIALSQLNRGVEKREDKRPSLGDLRESGAIEQDADMVCFIHRDDYYNRESEEKGIAEFIVAKNRNGEQDTVRLAWLPQYTLFANLSEDEAGTPVGGGNAAKGDVYL